MDHPWPFAGLVLRTPRLELRPDDDAGLFELVETARDGVHAPEEMPFAVPWTDAAPEDLGRDTVQFYWSQRAALSARDWTLNFLVRLDGRVVGVQALSGTDFPVLREVRTGSWIGLRHQGRGIGTEMRAAVLLFAFDHLGAETATSSAFDDNPRSRGVSRRLGYRENGTCAGVRRGQRAEQTRLLLRRDDLVRPDWTPRVTGVTECLHLLTGGQPTG